VALAAALLTLSAVPAHAYIGPGAGFALLSSFLVVFTTIILVGISLLLWPIRALLRLLRRGTRAKPWAKRLIVLGFDGQDPRLTDRLIGEGKLPNLQRLARMGCYHRLRTTYPSISPVAWSSFSTGTQPAKHSIYDFLDRDRRTYLPLLSSTHIGQVRRFLKLGRFRIPLERPELRLLRKSKPFWSLLGEHLVWSTVLRVPITFPPDKFHGAQLSAMCAPDLLGSQGTFLLYTTRPAAGRFKEGGVRIALERKGNGSQIVTSLKGPENMFVEGNPPLELPMTIEADAAAGRAMVRLDGRVVQLEPGRLGDWTPFAFRAAPGIKVSGICRMMLIELGEHVSLYVSPLNIDPDRPAMPISHPSYYATYLAKRIGPYATLGLAEDTWALNEGVIDDASFLKQAYDIDREREQMFFLSLERLRSGSLTCVFDATDRIQHMFWRYLEPDHPAARGRDPGEHKHAIEAIYRRNDELVGKVLERIGKGDVLMVISDHGFTSFRRGCNPNAWLRANGYLALKPGASGSEEWLQGVDWSRTRAYALGLSGMFLNLKGREAHGIVEPGEEARRLKAELISKLSGLVDAETGKVGIREAFDTWGLYQGPYLVNAPDLIIGYDEGYRVSWDGATGLVATPVFEDNVKAWSGDHCVDPRLVPGVFFCNYPVEREDPGLLDIAPTALRLFGLTPPGHMEGQTLFTQDPLARKAAGGGAA
jgi:predicted AlkP superfamily phosphohydrolase/phosphomutase